MYLAGFDVKTSMTDLISGRETLEDIQFIGAVGGFSNSDVLVQPKVGQEHFIQRKSKTALDNFFKREDTLSVGFVTVVSCLWNWK
jgi:phosphoribosylformylglycinamidine synthase